MLTYLFGVRGDVPEMEFALGASAWKQFKLSLCSDALNPKGVTLMTMMMEMVMTIMTMSLNPKATSFLSSE